MLNRRQVMAAIFGTGCFCPKWLEKLLLTKHPKQITETVQYDGSARDIVERVLRGSDTIDAYVDLQKSSCDCVDDAYFRGMSNGLLLAQKTLQGEPYHPI